MKPKTGSRAFSISGPALWNEMNRALGHLCAHIALWNDLYVPICNAILTKPFCITFWKLLQSHLFDLASHIIPSAARLPVDEPALASIMTL